jgi:hypothetical protein
MAEFGSNPMKLFKWCLVVDQPNSGEVTIWHDILSLNFGEDGLPIQERQSESVSKLGPTN